MLRRSHATRFTGITLPHVMRLYCVSFAGQQTVIKQVNEGHDVANLSQTAARHQKHCTYKG